MPISPDQLASIEVTVNRLAAEAVLAMPGRDDGLIPAYSLLGDLRDLCGSVDVLREPVAALLGDLEKLLDAAQPFNDGAIARLRRLVEWLPVAAGAAKASQSVPPFVPVSGASDKAGTNDVLLALNLEENRELLAEFYAESVEHLQQIEAALLALEQQPDEPEALNSIFRAFHTIKGNAGFLGLVPMHTLAHEVESLLDLARNQKLRLSSAIITEILRSRDALQALTHQVACALEKGQLPAQIVPVSHLIVAVKKLALAAETSAEPEEISAPEPEAPALETGVAEMDPESAPEIAPAMAIVPEASSPTAVPFAPAGRPRAPTPNATTGSKPNASSATVRVNTEKLDSLMDVVGELVIVQSQLIETSRQYGGDGSPLHRNVGQLSRITKELQHTAMSLRMIPIKPTFQKMERLSRDLARDCGKKVAFLTSGEDTELDRTVVEEMADPLVHMVRNALDHGLEPPAERLKLGKPESGILHLKAYHQGSNIVVELQDDGRGIDPAKVLAKARRQGLVPENVQLTLDETVNLIFLPGFSTAEKVTSVSGRGVGMDVVKRNIEKLRGKIEITSEPGRGSTFKIKLPLTMAIIDGLVVRVGEDRFILPSTSVQMALRPARENISTVHGQGEVLDLRGKMVPIHRLHRLFEIAAQAQNPWDGIVVIVEASGKISALLVDEMVSKQEVVIKNLGSYMQGLPGVAGGAILGDGNIALILDPGSLLQKAA